MTDEKWGIQRGYDVKKVSLLCVVTRRENRLGGVVTQPVLNRTKAGPSSTRRRTGQLGITVCVTQTVIHQRRSGASNLDCLMTSLGFRCPLHRSHFDCTYQENVSQG